MNTSNTLLRLGERLERARLDRNLTQAQLAHEAGVAKRTVERLEKGESVQLSTLIRVLAALDLDAGFDALVPTAEARPMDLLRRSGRPRKRATGKRNETPPAEPWHWDDDE